MGRQVGYNDQFDADEQISLEEDIASAIFSFEYHKLGRLINRPSEAECQQLGRNILLMVVERLRPDLIETVSS